MNEVCAEKNFIENAENEAMITILTNYINITQSKYGNYLIQDFL
jgi:carbamate kinase